MDKIELTPEQQTEYEGYLNEYINKITNIIKILKDYITRFAYDNINKGYIPDLTNGLDLLEIAKTRAIKEGTKEIAHFINDKVRFGLSRGFSEFLNTGEDWQDEILDPVYELEIYFATMGTPPLPEYPFKPEDPIGHFSWKDKDKNNDLDR